MILFEQKLLKTFEGESLTTGERACDSSPDLVCDAVFAFWTFDGIQCTQFVNEGTLSFGADIIGAYFTVAVRIDCRTTTIGAIGTTIVGQ